MKKLSILIISMMSVFSLTAQTPGTLDLSFGNNGTILVDFGGSSNHCISSAIQPDQKIVLAGHTFNASQDMSFARLKTDGTLDSGFGSGGIITHLFGATDETLGDVAVQPNGFILAVGSSFDGDESTMIVVRMTPVGLLDPSFSNDGMASIDFGFIDGSWGEAIALQDNGKIVIAGQVRDLLGDVQCGVARLNPDGSLDNSFGNSGIIIRNILSMDNYINNVALQGNKIVVGGMSYDGDNFYITIARFTTEGIPDPGFGVNGHISRQLVMDPWIFSSMGAMCLDEENRIIYGTYYEQSGDKDYVIYRFLPNGEPDIDFGDNGLKVIQLPGNNSINAITAQLDNKIIATGASDIGGTPIVRCLENGDHDLSFGPNGTEIAYSEAINYIYSLNIQDDGLVIAAGEEYNGSDNDFAASRYYSGLNVGISSENVQEVSLSIYPNPALSQINISIPAGKEITEISIYNQLGQQYIQQSGNSTQLDVSSLSPGIYAVKVWIDDTSVTRRLIINQH